jgi:hypothetical protein
MSRVMNSVTLMVRMVTISCFQTPEHYAEEHNGNRLQDVTRGRTRHLNKIRIKMDVQHGILISQNRQEEAGHRSILCVRAQNTHSVSTSYALVWHDTLSDILQS